MRVKTKHNRGGDKNFDERAPIKNKFYFQCILAQSELFEAGALPFTSQLPQLFYKLLLKSPAKAKPGMKLKDLRSAIAVEDGVPPALAAIEDEAPQPQQVPQHAPLVPVAAGGFCF